MNTEDSLGTKNPEFPSVRSQYKLPMAWVKMSVAKNAKIPSKAKNLMMRRIEPNARVNRRLPAKLVDVLLNKKLGWGAQA